MLYRALKLVSFILFQLDLLFRFCCYILQNLSKLFGHWKIILAYKQRKKMKKKTTKATPYLLYTYSKIEIESPFFSQLCLFLSFGRLFHPPFVCVFFSFLSISIRFRISFFLLFYAITIRANSLTYDVIYTLWNEINFNAKSNFRSLFDRYTQYIHIQHTEHTYNKRANQ